jgi:hypothetical protein
MGNGQRELLPGKTAPGIGTAGRAKSTGLTAVDTRMYRRDIGFSEAMARAP